MTVARAQGITMIDNSPKRITFRATAVLIALWSAVLVVLACAGCHAPVVATKPQLFTEGELFLYLEPFSQEARRLDFRLAGISALKSDGTEVPLSLRLPEITPENMKWQRMIGSVILPGGRYVGLSFRVAGASLRGEEGKAALLVPEKPVTVDFPFVVEPQKAVLISLALDAGASVSKRYSFSPVFKAEVPVRPLQGLTGFVTNRGGNTITVFDKREARVTEFIETGRGPAGIAFDQAARRAYVALSGDDAIEVIDLMADYTLTRIRLSIGDAPTELALTPDGRTLLVSNSGSNTLSFVDPVSQSESARVIVGSRPGAVIVDRLGRTAYVLNTLSNSVSVVDIARRAVVATLATETSPLWAQLNRRGDRLLVIHELSPYLVDIDLNTRSVAKRVYVGMGVRTIKIDANTDQIYIAKRGDTVIDVFDPFSLLPGDFITGGGSPSFLTIDGEHNNLLALLPAAKRLQFIGLVGKREVAQIDVGDEPYRVVVVGER
jgi:YVTN family beta-propeller protein